MITRHLDPKHLNQIIRHPEVKPHLGHIKEGLIEGLVADPANFLLMGKEGGVLFQRLQPGLYEAHTVVLPAGRGAWAVSMAREALTWMFCHTDAMEIVTKTPTMRARALAKMVGGVRDGRVVGHDGKETDVFRLTLQGWMSSVDGMEDNGSQVADLIPFPDYGPLAHRPLGILHAMFHGGQLVKGIIMFNRWALIAGYDLANQVSAKPASFVIRDTIIVVRASGEIYAATSRKH